MTTRADVDRLGQATSNLVDMARRDMAQLMSEALSNGPDYAEAMLLEVVPALVREYGVAASAIASEWYDEIRELANAPGFAPAVSPSSYPASGVRKEVQSVVPLLGDDSTKALMQLQSALQRYVAYGSRATIRRRVAADALGKPRYARVPVGAHTCAFCEMLSSRGWVYWSRASAGDTKLGKSFHDDCDCQIVADFDRKNSHIAGYDPDAMYDRYKTAYDSVMSRSSAEAADPAKVLAEMRALFPGVYTDGHTH